MLKINENYFFNSHYQTKRAEHNFLNISPIKTDQGINLLRFIICVLPALPRMDYNHINRTARSKSTALDSVFRKDTRGDSQQNIVNLIGTLKGTHVNK